MMDYATRAWYVYGSDDEHHARRQQWIAKEEWIDTVELLTADCRRRMSEDARTRIGEIRAVIELPRRRRRGVEC